LKPSVIILAYNSELSIGETIASILPLTDDIHIVDSFSKDRTVEIARGLGAQVTEHAFESYGAQRNWAIDHCPVRYAWQLHLDADERLTPELLAEIADLPEDARETGFILPRLMTFLGRPIRHGGLYPTWHMRLFKNGLGRCEMRKYDQHFYVVSGTTRQLKHDMIDDIRMPLSEWTFRHNRWADAEVEEQSTNADAQEVRVGANSAGNVIERKRALRERYNNAPLFLRPFLLFVYRYFFKLGFLDGTEGFIFYVLQTFWFRFLIDAKTFERRKGLAASSGS
jgi:glycosyltransferase involved in cell wall biosynthesis